MKIQTIPCLRDNFAYLIICEDTQHCAMVDPSEADPLLEALRTQPELQPVAILNTHHHWDHTGGNAGLLQAYPELKVYGHHSDKGRIAGQNVFLESGDTLQIGELAGRVHYNPGHTLGAVSYAFEDALFTGDTLFAAGCGRTFEGSAEQMHHSLNQVIGSFDDETRLFFGHEYTLNNLRFAQAVEPNNPEIQARIERVKAQLQQGHSTPSRLKEERQSNPFLRCEQEAVQQSARQQEPDLDIHTPHEVFRVLRAWKDRF